MDPATSARVPGFVETIPFRLTFVGRTASLRSFLNELASFKVPAVVRSVEVEPLSSENGGGDRSGQGRPPRRPGVDGFFSTANGDSPLAQVAPEKPLVEQVDSRFIVTVEIVSLVQKDSVEESSETAEQSIP